MTTGQRIKAARKNAGLTQKELGQRLGVAYQTLAQWENDLRNPKPDTLQRIAAALDVSIYMLLDDDEKELYRQAEVNLVLANVKAGYKFTTDEKLLVRLFHSMNDRGQERGVETMWELSQIPRYRAEHAPQSPLQTSEGTDTTQGLEGSEEAKSPSDE